MDTHKKTLKIPLRIAIIVLLAGMVAKIFQESYASGLILMGFSSIGLLYSIRFWKKQERKNVDFIKLFLILFWVTNGILRILDFPYGLFFQIMTAIFFLVWVVMEGTAYFLDEDRKSKNSLSHVLWNCAMVLGTLGIILGSLLKVLNWEFATVLLVFGIAVIAAYILKDFFETGKPRENDQNNEEFQL